MKFLNKNKTFLSIIFVIIAILSIVLFSMPYLLDNTKYTKMIEHTTKYNFDQENNDTYFTGKIPNINGDRKILSIQEAKNTLNLDSVYHLIDVLVDYKINNLEDYQYLKGNDGKYRDRTKEEFTDELFTPFTIINNKVYGDVYYLRNDFFAFILMTPDASCIYFYRGFNYTSSQEATLDLDLSNLDWLISYAKTFFSNFSPEVANSFSPTYFYLDDSGHVYTLIDAKNNLKFSYDFLYQCPCCFSIGFN